MIELTGGRSLGGRLSARLALQSLVGLTVLTLLVYLAIDSHLLARQERSLDEMEALVVHLVEEASTRPRAKGLEHALRDQFGGREDARLELLGPDDLPVSPSEHAIQHGSDEPINLAGEHVRTRTFVLPDSHGSAMSSNARLSLSTVADDDLLRQLAFILVGAVVLGTTIVSAAAFWRVRRELEPLERLVTQVNALDASNLERRIEGDGQPSELLPLIERFNGLLDRLDLAYGQMAAFNADVAHELNTPLATMITGNEIASRRRLSEEESHELIGSNLEELRRLGGIIRDMLFLSTAERGVQARAVYVPSLANEVCAVLDFHEAALEEAQLETVIEGDAAADIDVPLVQRALSNLVSNATRHATPGTTVIVRIEIPEPPLSKSARTTGRNMICLSVINRGPTVPPHHLKRLFDRFYRADDTHSAASNSATEVEDRSRKPTNRHGLGLSIVAAVARMHGGTTVAESEKNDTTIGFTLPSFIKPIDHH